MMQRTLLINFQASPHNIYGGDRLMQKYDYKEIYFHIDKKGSIFTMPTGQRINPNMIVSLDIINTLEPSYSDSDVIRLIYDTFAQCYTQTKEGPPGSTALKDHFGKKYYSTMRKVKLIDISWNKDDGYYITPIEGCLKVGIHLEDKRKILGLNPADEEFFLALKQAVEESTTANKTDTWGSPW